MDGNRAEDGIDLRYRFGREQLYSDAMVASCLDCLLYTSSAWADGREQDAIIEEKINEALAAREHGEKESEEP